MDAAQSTSTALLDGLRDPANHALWNEFCGRYRPTLISFGHKLGLNTDDAQDAAQETLCAFVSAYRGKEYDREKGGLRTWLFRIAAHKIRDIQRRRCKEHAFGKESTTALFEKIPDDHTWSSIWDAEWKQAVLKAALEQVRQEVEPATMRAFELVTLKDWPEERAAAHLQMTVNAVSKAKRRVLSKMRQVRSWMERDW
jgi:RNA polymerase sigma factor (sigma-70 family)